MDSEDYLVLQRKLRRQLLDRRIDDCSASGRDLAAHLLLYLDDSVQCWKIALEWLRESLDADRIDGGFTNPQQAQYRLLAEAVRKDLNVPTSVGTIIDAKVPAVRSVWASCEAVLFQDIRTDCRFTEELRARLVNLNAKSKMAVSLRSEGKFVGIICCDLIDRRVPWSSEQYSRFSIIASQIMGPVFAAAYRITAEQTEHQKNSLVSQPPGQETHQRSPLATLTPAELNVARLIAVGLSYKEVALQLNRSFSTVDHCLRSIRDKLGVSSTARMIPILAELFAEHP